LKLDTTRKEANMHSWRTILHPTDFSNSSRLAFQLAATLLQSQGGRLIVLHVKQAFGPMVSYGAALAQLETPGEEDRLRRLVEQFAVTESRIAIEHRIVEGNAATEILNAARDSQCDLIVMGSHGRTELDRLELGSVAEQVIGKAPCPVVTIRPGQNGSRFRPPLRATMESLRPALWMRDAALTVKDPRSPTVFR
jgi:nucleotide-binding universal stress UspA family protein